MRRARGGVSHFCRTERVFACTCGCTALVCARPLLSRLHSKRSKDRPYKNIVHSLTNRTRLHSTLRCALRYRSACSFRRMGRRRSMRAAADADKLTLALRLLQLLMTKTRARIAPREWQTYGIDIRCKRAPKKRNGAERR